MRYALLSLAFCACQETFLTRLAAIAPHTDDSCSGLTAPTGVTATADSSGIVQASWSGGPYDSVLIERQRGDNAWEKLGVVPAPQQTTGVTGSTNTAYRFRVSGTVGSCQSNSTQSSDLFGPVSPPALNVQATSTSA